MDDSVGVCVREPLAVLVGLYVVLAVSLGFDSQDSVPDTEAV